MFTSFPLANTLSYFATEQQVPTLFLNSSVKQDALSMINMVQSGQNPKMFKSHITCCSSGVQLSLHGYQGIILNSQKPPGRADTFTPGVCKPGKKQPGSRDSTFEEPVCEPSKSQVASFLHSHKRKSPGQGQGVPTA